tara:strand:+ start:171 stop:1052 length:882 start_codon:yes stop_codon:yes gene_type:complete
MNQLATLINSQRNQEVTQVVTGKPLNIGDGFEALSFKYDQFDGLIDPLVMMDHYVMTRPTFGAHPHAGMSAVSILFEDSEGVFNNRDSLGNNIDLLPGDAYWLKAGSGAVHDEKPTQGSRTHGLQIFVNLPRRNNQDAPASKHVSAQAIPVITGEGYRVRVVFGESNGVCGASSPALPFTALDALLESGSGYSHLVGANNSLMVYAVSGEVDVSLPGSKGIHLPANRALAIHIGKDADKVNLSSNNQAHVVILQGAPVQEQFVQAGPFVMNSLTEIQQVTAAFDAGLLGKIAS